jgi:uncharacterized protein with gpF-like domain
MSALKATAQQIAIQRRFAGLTGKRMGNPPQPRTPAKSELQYVAYVRRITTAMRLFTSRLLDDYLPRITASYNEEVRRDSWADDLEGFRVELTNGYDNILAAGGLAETIDGIAQSVDKFNQGDFQRVVKSVFGVNVFSFEPWKDSLLKSWTNDNVQLIKNLSNQTAENVHQIVSRGTKEGTRVTHIRKQILSTLKLDMENSGQTATTVSEMRKLRNRAELIAVDQTGKLNGQLTKNRQEDIGVTGYIWRNVGDERVRGNPSGPYSNAKYDHWHREGKDFLWSTPPPDGHPGQPIRCRCGAEANLTELIAEIETIETKAA